MKLKVTLCLLLVGSFVSASAHAIEVKFERDTTIPMVYLNVAIKAGAAHDPKGQSGASNFMGQMLRRGTLHKSKNEIDLAFDQIGAQLEVETRSEALILRGATLSKKLPEFLNLLRELITEANFPESEIIKLKREVVSKILEERGKDGALARTKWEEFLFTGHPYGNPVKGTIGDIEKLKRRDIVQQYDRFFQDQHILVVGSGDSESALIDTWAKGISEKRPNRKRKDDIQMVSAPSIHTKRRVEILDKPERTQTQVFIGQNGVRMTDPEYFPLYLGNHAFGGGSFSAKLMVEIRVKRGWSYSAYSYFRQGLQPRSWQTFYFPATKDTPEAIALGLQLITDLKENGITKDDYEFAKASLVNSSGFMFNTPQKRVENILLERTLQLPDGFMKSYGKKLEEVSWSEVNASFKKFLKPEALSILVLGTAKEIKTKIAKATNVPENEILVVPFNQD